VRDQKWGNVYKEVKKLVWEEGRAGDD